MKMLKAFAYNIVWAIGVMTIMALVCVSCQSWDKKFEGKLNLSMNDGIVTEQEYLILKNELTQHPEGASVFGRIIRTEDDLVSFFRERGISGTAAALNVTEAPFRKFYIMLENSASMEGYSKSSHNRDFSTPVISLWNAVGNDTQVETGYAHHDKNSKCEFEQVSADKFQADLTNGKTKTSTSSPIDQIIGYAVNLTDDTSVAAIITDGIMSGTNDEILSSLPNRMWTYNNMPVLEQRVREAMLMACQKGLAFSVYQFETSFKGTYYNFKNLKQSMNEVERPFYIILLGAEKHVRNMDLALQKDKKFDYEHHLSSYEIGDIPTIKTGVFSVVPMPGVNLGDFNQSPAKMEITFKKELTLPVSLSLKVTMPYSVSNELADEDYLKDNVRVISIDPLTKHDVDLTWIVQRVEADSNSPGMFNFIMEAVPDFVNIISGVRVLRLTVPVSYEHLYSWYVEDSIDSDVGSNWDTDKTFALSNMMDSFFNGYDIQPKNFIDITLQLKK